MIIKNKDRLRYVNLAGVFILTMALSSCVAYLYQTAPPPGYCDITDSITADEVFIEKAVAETGKDSRKFEGKNYSVLNCCLVHRLDAGFFAKLVRWDPGVWVSFAYEKSQWEKVMGSNKQKYSHLMAYSDSCGRYRPVNDDTPFPPASFNWYGELDQDNAPAIDKKALKHFVKWPK